MSFLLEKYLYSRCFYYVCKEIQKQLNKSINATVNILFFNIIFFFLQLSAVYYGYSISELMFLNIMHAQTG